MDSTKELLNVYPTSDLFESTVRAAQNNDPNYTSTLKMLQKTFPQKVIEQKDTVKSLTEPFLANFGFTDFEGSLYEKLYYHSVKRGPLGKSAKFNTMPETITNDNTTFGHKYKYEKLPIDHPSDKINEKPPSDKINIKNINREMYNEHFRKLEKKKKNIELDSVEKILKACDVGKKCIINTTRDNDLRKKVHQLSKCMTTQNLNIDPNFTYGHGLFADEYRGKLLIQNLNPCNQLLQLYLSISYLNSKRIQLKHRRDFHFHDIHDIFLQYDPELKKKLPIELVYKLLHQSNVVINIMRSTAALKHFNAIDDDYKFIFYDKLIKLLNASYPLPSLTGLIKLPTIDTDLATTYREFTTDLYRHPIDDTDDIYNIHEGRSVVHLDKLLGKENDMLQVLSPSVESQFGLTHRDYLLPRSQDDIKFIFRKIIEDLNDNEFMAIWNEAKTLLTSANDKVSVEAFKCVLNKTRKMNRYLAEKHKRPMYE